MKLDILRQPATSIFPKDHSFCAPLHSTVTFSVRRDRRISERWASGRDEKTNRRKPKSKNALPALISTKNGVVYNPSFLQFWSCGLFSFCVDLSEGLDCRAENSIFPPPAPFWARLTAVLNYWNFFALKAATKRSGMV